MDRTRRVIILGSGRVASHLAVGLSRIAHVEQIWSRNIDHARQLAEKIGAEAVDDITKVDRTAHLYLIAVADDAIAEIAASLNNPTGIVAHTSGSIGIEALGDTGRRAVFYPLQTFGKDRPATLDGIPVFTEASDDDSEHELQRLAKEMGMTPHHADSAKRARLHLAAVFANNFANHMWAEAEDLLAADNLTLDVFAPLLRESLDKALASGAHNAQTGPAVRHDTGVIDRQQRALEGNRRKLYALISGMIMKAHPINE